MGLFTHAFKLFLLEFEKVNLAGGEMADSVSPFEDCPAFFNGFGNIFEEFELYFVVLFLYNESSDVISDLYHLFIYQSRGRIMVFKPLKVKLESSEFFLGIVYAFFDAL